MLWTPDTIFCSKSTALILSAMSVQETNDPARGIHGMDSPQQEPQRGRRTEPLVSVSVPWDNKVLLLFSLLPLIRRTCVKNTESALMVQVINFCSSSEHTETRQDQLRPKPHKRIPKVFHRTATHQRMGANHNKIWAAISLPGWTWSP